MTKQLADMVKAALDEREAADAALIKELKDRVDHLEAVAPSKVLTNGALPPAHLMRGQDAAAAPDTTHGIQLRKQLSESRDSEEQRRLSAELNSLALAELSRIHAR